MSADSPPPGGYKLCPQCRQIYAASVELCPNDNARLVIERRILVGKYILLNRIGSGSGSEVYAAEQPQLGRMVAIKLLPRDPEVERGFDSQVRSIGTVKHEHVVTLYDSGRAEDGRPYIAMEYLEGENLAERLVRTGAMAGDRALTLWRQAVSAIAAAHRRHIVHGDINPTNLFLTQRESDEGPQEIVKVIDFRIGPRGTLRTAADSGGHELAHYVAPEQLQSGTATTRSDVYALGLVLLEMLNGRLPRESAVAGKEEVSQALMLQLGQSQPGLGGSIRGPLSGELLALVGDVLRRDPARRPVDAMALLQLIRKLPDVGRLVPSSAALRLDEEVSPPSQATEPDWLAGAKTPKERKSSAANPLPGAEIPSSAFIPSDVLETPDLGIEIAEPAWLTGTQEQRAMLPLKLVVPPPDDSALTIEAKSSVAERADPYLGSETPQMGVAVLTELLQQINAREPLTGPPPAPPAPPAPPVPPVKPAPHWSRIGLRIFFIVLVFGTLGGGLALLVRTKWPLSPGSVLVKPDLAAGDGARDAAVAPAVDLATTDLAVGAEATGLDAGAANPADLDAPVDAASDSGGPGPGAIKVRFVYDEDAVTSIECNQESLVAPSAAEKRGGGVEAILRPGGFCRATGPRGGKTYKYETLVQKRPDSTAVRRIRIRMSDTADGDQAATPKSPRPATAPAAKKSPEATAPEELPRPPPPTGEGGTP